MPHGVLLGQLHQRRLGCVGHTYKTEDKSTQDVAGKTWRKGTALEEGGGVGWINLAQDRNKRLVVNNVVNIRVP